MKKNTYKCHGCQIKIYHEFFFFLKQLSKQLSNSFLSAIKWFWNPLRDTASH